MKKVSFLQGLLHRLRSDFFKSCLYYHYQMKTEKLAVKIYCHWNFVQKPLQPPATKRMRKLMSNIYIEVSQVALPVRWIA